MASLSYIIVEDEPEFALLLKKYLDRIPDTKHLGTFGGTTDAVLNIERLRPEVLFLDINISGLEGPEFIDLLEYQPKVIIVSGHSEEVMENYDIDFVDYIQKPPTIETLTVALEKCR